MFLGHANAPAYKALAVTYAHLRDPTDTEAHKAVMRGDSRRLKKSDKGVDLLSKKASVGTNDMGRCGRICAPASRTTSIRTNMVCSPIPQLAKKPVLYRPKKKNKQKGEREVMAKKEREVPSLYHSQDAELH